MYCCSRCDLRPAGTAAGTRADPSPRSFQAAARLAGTAAGAADETAGAAASSVPQRTGETTAAHTEATQCPLGLQPYTPTTQWYVHWVSDPPPPHHNGISIQPVTFPDK